MVVAARLFASAACAASVKGCFYGALAESRWQRGGGLKAVCLCCTVVLAVLALLQRHIIYYGARAKAADELLQQADDALHVVILHHGLQLRQMALQLLPRNAGFLRAHDAGVLGGLGVVANEEFFVEFFAWAQTRDVQGNVAVRVGGIAHGKAREHDHLPSQFADFYGFAHVKHKHVAALRHCACLQHELGSFGDGHKVAGDFGVGEGDGSAVGDLLPEKRHNRA